MNPDEFFVYFAKMEKEYKKVAISTHGKGHHFPVNQNSHLNEAGTGICTTFRNIVVGATVRLEKILYEDSTAGSAVEIHWDYVPVPKPAMTASRASKGGNTKLSTRWEDLCVGTHKHLVLALLKVGLLECFTVSADVKTNAFIVNTLLLSPEDDSANHPVCVEDGQNCTTNQVRRGAETAVKVYKCKFNNKDVLVGVKHHYCYVGNPLDNKSHFHLDFSIIERHFKTIFDPRALEMPAKLLPPILVVAIELIEKRDGLLQTLTSKLQFPAGEIAAFLSKINALAQGVGTEDLLKEEGITHLNVQAVLNKNSDAKPLGQLLTTVFGVITLEDLVARANTHSKQEIDGVHASKKLCKYVFHVLLCHRGRCRYAAPYLKKNPSELYTTMTMTEIAALCSCYGQVESLVESEFCSENLDLTKEELLKKTKTAEGRAEIAALCYVKSLVESEFCSENLDLTKDELLKKTKTAEGRAEIAALCSCYGQVESLVESEFCSENLNLTKEELLKKTKTAEGRAEIAALCDAKSLFKRVDYSKKKEELVEKTKTEAGRSELHTLCIGNSARATARNNGVQTEGTTLHRKIANEYKRSSTSYGNKYLTIVGLLVATGNIDGRQTKKVKELKNQGETKLNNDLKNAIEKHNLDDIATATKFVLDYRKYNHATVKHSRESGRSTRRRANPQPPLPPPHPPSAPSTRALPS